MSMSTATGRSHRVVFDLLICHVIALLYRYELTIVVVAIVGETTTWRQDDGDHGVQAGDYGDHAGASRWRSRREVILAISCHL
jgi:hypothetical protein